MSVLVTGGNGFVGRALVARLRADGQPVTPLTRAELGDLGPALDARQALTGGRVVIHCAGRAHIMDDTANQTAADSLAAFRRVNTEGTLALARQAVEAGVRRFIFISSIKVNGEATPVDRPFTAQDAAAPADPYGVSKWEAEQGLLALGRETGLEVVIVRPVLVYGPGVKANFRSMMRWLDRGIPLPLGGIDNRRSLVALDNLVDLIVTCVDHPAAPGRAWLVSDGEDLSTSELLRRTGRAMGRPARLIPVPVGLLTALARRLGKGALAQRLFGSLRVDISDTRKTLQWAPPVTVDAALERTARDTINQERHR